MRGNSHVQFLGGGTAAMPSRYPINSEKTIAAKLGSSVHKCDDGRFQAVATDGQLGGTIMTADGNVLTLLQGCRHESSDRADRS